MAAFAVFDGAGLSGRIAVALGEPVNEAMAGLNRWLAARGRVVEHPKIRGGMPVMCGTRIGVYEAVDSLAGDGMECTLEDFPLLSREDLEAAALYVKEFTKTGRSSVRRERAGRNGWRLISETRVTVPVLDAGDEARS